jgi:hypothetical protein
MVIMNLRREMRTLKKEEDKHLLWWIGKEKRELLLAILKKYQTC